MFTFIFILVIVYILYRVRQRFRRQQGVIDRLEESVDRLSAKDKKNM
jgi:TATA-binding protein-associated factor Taf7